VKLCYRWCALTKINFCHPKLSTRCTYICRYFSFSPTYISLQRVFSNNILFLKHSVECILWIAYRSTLREMFSTIFNSGLGHCNNEEIYRSRRINENRSFSISYQNCFCILMSNQFEQLYIVYGSNLSSSLQIHFDWTLTIIVWNWIKCKKRKKYRNCNRYILITHCLSISAKYDCSRLLK
jgi:hypothetical protein